jgi:hypothetical protein
MIFLRNGALALVFTALHLNAQTTAPAITAHSSVSHIQSSNLSDASLPMLVVKGARYDASKNFLPYYLVTHKTAYHESAQPKLITRKTAPVTGSHAEVIRKYHAAYLGREFILEPVSSLSRNENMNHHRLFPFRITAGGEIEELIDYEVTWRTAPAAREGRQSGSSFVNNSVLTTGTWYKIGVTQTGLHRVTSAFLSNIGIRNAASANIRIYGNGGRMVPELNGAPRTDDLAENPLLMADGGDGVFNNNDYFLFYATGPTEWTRTADSVMKFKGVKNLYSDTSFYFINVDLGQGKRIQTQPSLAQQFNIQSSTYDFYALHEENIVNLAKSGREFLGETFDVVSSYRFSWSDGDFVTSDTVLAELYLNNGVTENLSFHLSGNGISEIISASANGGGQYAPYSTQTRKVLMGLNTGSQELSFTLTRQNKGVGWLNRMTVNARRYLVLSGRQYQFRDTRVAKAGNVCRYTVQTSSGGSFFLWNVTDPLDPYIQATEAAGGSVQFTAASDVLNEYCLAPSTDLYSPVYVGKVANQNLHNLQAAEYLIIAHPLFLKEAQRLGAFHKEKDGLSYYVATVDQVYNEFGSGKPDVSAIRDFIRMVYTRTLNTAKPLKHVLLMGDGSYNNRNRSLVNNSALIPTYQSIESWSATMSNTSDDFFALMDPDEGRFAEGKGAVDLGVGRFPCRSVTEVKGIIEKIENYYKKDPTFSVLGGDGLYNPKSESPLGDWRTWLLFLADDEDNALHMYQADQLASQVKTLNDQFNIDKIMLDAYQQFYTPAGPRYPDASEEFTRRMKKGALIFNYTGHGGEVGLAAERLIDLDIINSLDNFNKLTLFITATCEFSRYDDPGRTSAGELTLINPRGGAIALMTTSRLAFSNANFDLNERVLQKLFVRRPDGSWPTLGEAMMETKAGLGQYFTYAHFHLLGDPALTLAYPEYKVMTSAINGVQVDTVGSDTLSALAKVTISGYVADLSGNKLNTFNGLVYPNVFDKEQEVTGLLNEIGSSITGEQNITPFRFKMQKNLLYRGKAQVTNGDFSFTFIVPKDISFSPGPGRICYYATNGVTDASGVYTDLTVGGDSRNELTDDEGPRIVLFLNDKNFVNGGLTNEKPVLYADLVDSSGINTVGSGLGHDLMAVLDEQTSKPIVLNDFYEANLNSYQSGRVRYPFSRLEPGEHRLSFKAWDIMNNSSSVYADFVVAESAELALDHVLNYPNPFTTRTKFFFQHNQACNPLTVVIQVYTVTGKLVKTLQQMVTCSGLRPEGIEWDGRDDFGDKLGRGVYIYRLSVLDNNNKRAEKTEKLVILN